MEVSQVNQMLSDILQFGKEEPRRTTFYLAFYAYIRARHAILLIRSRFSDVHERLLKPKEDIMIKAADFAQRSAGDHVKLRYS